MSLVCYGVNGEGRGHATRTRGIVEMLRGRGHRVKIFTYGDALALLSEVYAGTEVELVEIVGPRYLYGRNGRVHYLKTFLGNLGLLLSIRVKARRLLAELQRDKPELIVCDFEPTMARAANFSGIPWVLLNHQHFVLTHDLRKLHWRLRLMAAFQAPFAHRFCFGQTETLVSSFFDPGMRLRMGLGRVRHIGVVLRPELLSVPVRVEQHVVAYLRKAGTDALLEALEGCGSPVRVYGLGDQGIRGNLDFRAITMDGFLGDLATCRALVCTAGNQLIGEALYLRKPVFAMAEPGNYEQEIHADFIGRAPWGRVGDMERVHATELRAFIEDAELLREGIPEHTGGNTAALQALEKYLTPPAAGRRRREAHGGRGEALGPSTGSVAEA